MKRLFGFLVCATIVSGCAVTTYNSLPVVTNAQVFAIKDSGRERLRAGNVLFVNRSPVEREVIVFDGYFDCDQLIRIGNNGFPELTVDPIGKFDIGSSDRNSRCEDHDYNRKLVKFKYPGQEYTLLIISKSAIGGIVGSFQVEHGRVSSRPASERYYYRQWIGPYAGQMVCEIVNDVEILPNIETHEYRGTNYLFDSTIDLNQLLRRGLHRMRGQHDR